MAAAFILTADRLADELIYQSGEWLTCAQISEFLKTKVSVSAGERGYAYLCDWVAMNAGKFSGESGGDVYGVIDGDYAYINRTVFRNACKDGGFDESAILSWLKVKSLIRTRGRAFTKPKKIGGVPVECVVMRMADFTTEEQNELDELL
jgi:hypothetical protein